MSYPISATAIVSDAPNGDHPSWRKETVQIREPGEDELLVKIIASGVCHTDIAISTFPEGLPGFLPYPKIMGHEGAGIVEQVGSKISHVKKGDKVLLSFDYCGNDGCRACEDETPGYCDEFHVKNLFNVPDVYQIAGGQSAGGLFFGQSSFSSIALVKGTSVVNVEQLVKDEEELKLFAPMGCGYQTGAAAVTELVNVGKKDVVVVFGLGGVGMSAIMAANVRGAHTIIGVDRVQSRLDLVKEMGATHVIDTSNFKDIATDLPAAIREIAPKGANAVLDTTGVVPLIAAAIPALHAKGQIILIGIVSGKFLDLDLGALLNFGTAIRGCIEGNAKPSKFVPQMIEWYRQGKFPIEKLTKFYQSDDFEKALTEMHEGSTIKPVLLW
ncbi:putative alcohol dehydrogenase [Stagonosporopsis vannaccii]|nr:putative alcohol dehydrogenase [Stagonosporopsis vannaccii]